MSRRQITPSISSSVTRKRWPKQASALLAGWPQVQQSPELIESIKDKDWKILEVMAERRREHQQMLEEADGMRRAWETEKENRRMMQAQQTSLHNQYIEQKREMDRSSHQAKQMEIMVNAQLEKAELINYLVYKDKRSEEVLASLGSLRNSMLSKKVKHRAERASLVQDRKSAQASGEHIRRVLESECGKVKVERARNRRNENLQNLSQYKAMKHSLNYWDSFQNRLEIQGLETAKLAKYIAKIEDEDRLIENIQLEKEKKIKRAKQLAEVTAQLREAVKTCNL